MFGLPDTIPSLIRPLWTLTLQDASWMGIPFVLTETEPTDGRRVVVHEYPKRDMPYVEDLGRANQVIPIKGYLCGDDVYEQRDAFKKACATTINLGTLVHPSLGSIPDVALLSCSFGEAVEDGRMVTLSLVFMRSLPPVYPGATELDQAAAKAGLNMKTSAFQDFVKSAKSVIGKIAGVVGTITRFAGLALAAVSIARSVMSAVAGIGRNLPASQSTGRYSGNLTTDNPAFAGIPTSPTASYIQAATTAGIAALTANRVLTQAANAAMIAAATTPITDQSFVNSVFASTEQARASIIDPADQIRALVPLCSFQPSPAISGTSGINVGINLMQTATAALCRRAALTSLALGCSDYQPKSSTATQAVIDQVGPLFDAEITYAADNGDLNSYRNLRELRTAVLSDLEIRGSQLPALITITRPISQPSLAVAWSLYQDANRSDDLITRANPRNPLFMPISFTALSA